jgi:hypothetical protein
MSCNFVDTASQDIENFSCRVCTVCGHRAYLSPHVDIGWDELVGQIVSQCPNNVIDVPPVAEQMRMSSTAADEQPAAAKTATGPGGFLKKYLGRIGITSTPNCSCNAKAKHMDTMGIEWCEQNLDTIVGWLKEEAENRRLPFVPWPARLLVKKAIAAAKKAAAKTRD